MKSEISTTLNQRFGSIPMDTGLKKIMRLHQGWWRINVLNEVPGLHPKNSNENVCNTILNGNINKKNFLSKNTIQVIDQTLRDRKEQEAGLMEQDRLFNNLLSSQPLCFNFFGELSADKNLGLSILKSFYPNITRLRSVKFEYAPKKNYTKDNSAFDVAFEVEMNNKVGLIGWECKYTDTFSAKDYSKPAYKEIFSKSTSFAGSYDLLKQSRTNQLFRNQLIAEGLLQNNEFDFVYTGLFCYQNNNEAIETAEYFQRLLNKENANFKIVTYADLIRIIQMLNISWEQREWSMLLWVRYCATVLSKETINQL